MELNLNQELNLGMQAVVVKIIILNKKVNLIIITSQMRWDPNKPAPTVHEFGKKVAEADAYLQILIDQIKVRTFFFATLSMCILRTSMGL